LAALITLSSAGCATQKIDWQARIGNYTYDQSVRDFGPPDKSAKLADGTLIADWMIRQGGTVVAPQPYPMPPYGFGPVMPAYSATYMPGYYLRLEFGPDGRLKSYKNFFR
jgi:hypothetical protein